MIVKVRDKHGGLWFVAIYIKAIRIIKCLSMVRM